MKLDVIKLLEEQSVTPVFGGGLPLIGIWYACRRIVMFFTFAGDQIASHYEAKDRYRYECLGDGCPACAVGLRPTTHLYLPVWDLENRQIAVLFFTTNPDGPAPKIVQFLKTYKEQMANVVAVIDSKGQGAIEISAREVLPETDRGAIECDEFAKGLESGAIDLHSCVRQLSAEAIRALPEVKQKSVPVFGSFVAPKNKEE